MLKVNEGAAIPTPACLSLEDSSHVTHDGATEGDCPEVPGVRWGKGFGFWFFFGYSNALHCTWHLLN